MIKDDKHLISKVDLLAIEKGIAQLDVHSLRVSTRKSNAAKIESLLDAMAVKHKIYQYKDKTISYRQYGWDLFFWCNHDSEGRDYSYVTLDTNKKRSVEQRAVDVAKALEDMQQIGLEGIEVYIQYMTTYDSNKVKIIVLDYLAKTADKPVEMMGQKGKIKPVGTNHIGETVYGFFKKGAKTKYWQLSYESILRLALANK
jgi:hypothetical protein